MGLTTEVASPTDSVTATGPWDEAAAFSTALAVWRCMWLRLPVSNESRSIQCVETVQPGPEFRQSQQCEHHTYLWPAEQETVRYALLCSRICTLQPHAAPFNERLLCLQLARIVACSAKDALPSKLADGDAPSGDDGGHDWGEPLWALEARFGLVVTQEESLGVLPTSPLAAHDGCRPQFMSASHESDDDG